MPWQSYPALYVMALRHPAQPRSRQQSMPGILGYNMYIRGQQFRGGDGIVSKGVENTLRNVGRLGKDGMKETNEEIIKIMIEA